MKFKFTRTTWFGLLVWGVVHPDTAKWDCGTTKIKAVRNLEAAAGRKLSFR